MKDNLQLTRLYCVFSSAYLALALLIFLIFQPPTHNWFHDIWDHTAAIKALSDNFRQPIHPHYGTPNSEYRQFTPYHIVIAAFVRGFSLSVFQSIAIGAFLNTAILIIGIYLFAREYYKSDEGPIYLVASLILFCGIPWQWTGFHSLRAQLYNNYYPSQLVLGLTFIAWYFIKLYQRQKKPIHLVSLSLIIPLSIIIHQLNGLFLLGSTLVLIMFTQDYNTRDKIKLSGIALISAALAQAWPFFNVIEVIKNTSNHPEANAPAAFNQLIPIFLCLGPAVVGFATIFNQACFRAHLAFYAMLLIITAGFAWGIAFNHTSTHRLLSFILLLLQIALTSYILDHLKRQDKSKIFIQFWKYRWKIFLVMIFAQIAPVISDLARIFAYEKFERNWGNFPNIPVIEEMTKVRKLIADSDIIIATSNPSLAVTSFGIKVIFRPRTDDTTVSNRDQRRSTERFFIRNTKNSERYEIIKAWKITHVLYETTRLDKNVQEDLMTFSEVVYQSKNLTLMRITLMQ